MPPVTCPREATACTGGRTPAGTISGDWPEFDAADVVVEDRTGYAAAVVVRISVLLVVPCIVEVSPAPAAVPTDLQGAVVKAARLVDAEARAVPISACDGAATQPVALSPDTVGKSTVGVG